MGNRLDVDGRGRIVMPTNRCRHRFTIKTKGYVFVDVPCKRNASHDEEHMSWFGVKGTRVWWYNGSEYDRVIR